MTRKTTTPRFIVKALYNDAKTFLGSTDGQATAHKKALFIGASMGIALSIFMFTMTKSPSQASTPPMTPSLPVLSAEALYDFRDDTQHATSLDSAKHLVLQSGQSLGPLLQNNGIDPNTAYATTQAFAEVYDPKNLRVGQKINLYFNTKNGEFSGLSLKPNVEHTLFIDRQSDGSFAARKVTAEFETNLVLVNSRIENSLYLDANKLGAPDKVIVQFSQIYAHSVDFQRDIRAGDEFEMLFEAIQDHTGKTIKAGNLLYTSFSPRGKTSSYYLYTKENGHEGYYDEKGKGAKRMLMRTPINGARLSSRYGSRRHPVLGYRRKHKGVDFAAPRGTPIMAAGTGTIVRSSRFGTYGNYIRIKHTDGYSTAYAHLSKYARGVKKGRRVIQGQTIGYVGATGRVTGAHLHYEVLKNGRQINPMSLATLSGKPLKKAEIPAFKKRVAEINALRNNIQQQISEPTLNAEVSVEPENYVIAP